MGAWVHGCMGAWVHGCMGAWVHGCMGACAIDMTEISTVCILECVQAVHLSMLEGIQDVSPKSVTGTQYKV